MTSHETISEPATLGPPLPPPARAYALASASEQILRMSAATHPAVLGDSRLAHSSAAAGPPPSFEPIGRVAIQYRNTSRRWESVGGGISTARSNLPTLASCGGSWPHVARVIPTMKVPSPLGSLVVLSMSLTIELRAWSCSDSGLALVAARASRSSMIRSLLEEPVALSPNVARTDSSSSTFLADTTVVETDWVRERVSANQDAILVLPTPGHPDITTAVGEHRWSLV
mmetsp:Transcript_8925/g.20272  ORF Transcript_8925/g.20272 Transcript_8925/m.20272 type:complete len:228 (+) Transcript_8925:973-1656(+)